MKGLAETPRQTGRQIVMEETTDATLTKTERNTIFKLVGEYGPSPNEFNWTERQQDEWSDMSSWPYRVSVLTHTPTGYYCTFGAHSVTTCPGLKSKVEHYRHEDDWSRKESACGRWLVELKIEVDAPDLWASMARETALPKAASSATLDNRLFTPAEQSRIGTKLDEIKEFLLKGQQFDAKEAEFVQQEFAYLRGSATRFGRKDWLRVLFGVLVGQAFSLALTPEKANGLLHFAGLAFQWVWGAAELYLK